MKRVDFFEQPEPKRRIHSSWKRLKTLIRIPVLLWIGVLKQRCEKTRFEILKNTAKKRRDLNDQGFPECKEYGDLKEFARVPNRASGYNSVCKDKQAPKPKTSLRPDRLKPDCTSCRKLKLANPGQRKRCATCINREAHHKTDKLSGRIAVMMNAAIGNSKKRGMAAPLIDQVYLIELYWNQRGRCGGTGLVLSWKKHSKNKMSLERLDNTRPYEPGNVLLVIDRWNSCDYTASAKGSPINGSSQMTEAKFVEFHRGRQTFSFVRDCELRKRFARNGWFPNRTKFNDTNEEPIRVCANCYFHKPLAEFRTTSYCRQCHFIIGLVDACKRMDQDRQKSCDLTFEILVEKIIQQNGLCYICQHTLNFQCLSDFQMSVERLDNSQGHVDRNTVLICLEHQLSNSVIGPHVKQEDIEQTRQMTREAFDEIFWPCGLPAEPAKWPYIPQSQRFLPKSTQSFNVEFSPQPMPSWTVPIVKLVPRPETLDFMSTYQSAKIQLSIPKIRLPNELGQWKCTACSIYKPENQFGICKSRKSGRKEICKDCNKQPKKQFKVEFNETSKVCSACREWVPYAQFSQDKKGIAGLNQRCKTCCAAQYQNKKNDFSRVLKYLFSKYSIDNPCTIDILDLLDIYKNQRGRCYKTGLILDWKPGLLCMRLEVLSVSPGVCFVVSPKVQAGFSQGVYVE